MLCTRALNRRLVDCCGGQSTLEPPRSLLRCRSGGTLGKSTHRSPTKPTHRRDREDLDRPCSRHSTNRFQPSCLSQDMSLLDMQQDTVPPAGRRCRLGLTTALLYRGSASPGRAVSRQSIYGGQDSCYFQIAAARVCVFQSHCHDHRIYQVNEASADNMSRNIIHGLRRRLSISRCTVYLIVCSLPAVLLWL